jgi:AcrR family transcriptional regulator
MRHIMPPSVIIRGSSWMTKKLAKSAISQKRVLDAAARIFGDYGYAGTTMRAIADAAELKAGSIYYHYSSKDELISAVLDLAINALYTSVKTALDRLPADATGRQKIEVAVHAHLSAIIEYGDYALATRRVFGQLPQAVRAKNMRLRTAYAAMWQDILVQAQRAGEFRPEANLKLMRLFILGALNWTVEWFKPGGIGIEGLAKEFSSLIIDGLALHGGTFLAGATPAPARRVANRVRVTS